jgi:hypothetical protein
MTKQTRNMVKWSRSGETRNMVKWSMEGDPARIA